MGKCWKMISLTLYIVIFTIRKFFVFNKYYNMLLGIKYFWKKFGIVDNFLPFQYISYFNGGIFRGYKPVLC